MIGVVAVVLGWRCCSSAHAAVPMQRLFSSSGTVYKWAQTKTCQAHCAFGMEAVGKISLGVVCSAHSMRWVQSLQRFGALKFGHHHVSMDSPGSRPRGVFNSPEVVLRSSTSSMVSMDLDLSCECSRSERPTVASRHSCCFHPLRLVRLDDLALLDGDFFLEANDVLNRGFWNTLSFALIKWTNQRAEASRCAFFE